MKQFGGDKETKLYQAVWDNDLAIVKSLIKEAKKFGVEEEMIEIPNKDGVTPLMVASTNNNVPIVKLLMQEGAIVSKKNNSGNTAAHLALLNGSNDVLRHLFIRGVKVDEKGEYNLTLLHSAAGLNSHSTVDMLLKEFNGRSFINDASNGFEMTPLSFAIWSKGDLKMVQILIGAGANKEKVNSYNKTALDYAKHKKKMDIVNYLENM